LTKAPQITETLIQAGDTLRDMCLVNPWQIDRIKDRLTSVVGGDWGNDPAEDPAATDIAVIRVADIRGLTVDTSGLTIRNVQKSKLADRRISANSILIEKSGGGENNPVGRAVYPGTLGFDAICSNFMAKLECDSSVYPPFLNYVFHSMYVTGINKACIQQTTGIQNLAITRYLCTKIGFPRLEEQQRIAVYLDASYAAIDTAVAAKRSQLKILDALLKSIIHQAVTKGLNADVRMKPSQIDWLPEVPTHWEVKQIKRKCSMVRGKFAHRPRNDPAFYDGEYPFVQTGDITAAQKYILSYSQTLNELGLSVSRMFPKGTLVMSIAANIGDVAILDFEACFPDSMVGFIPDHKTDLSYLYYLLRAMKDIMLRSAVLTTQLNINYVRIGTNFAPFPPKTEQQAIAEFLDTKEAEILATKDILNQQIETLTSYRRSLIHECVTGKRRITERELASVQAHA
jgi:type I restriction enzyme S subunit